MNTAKAKKHIYLGMTSGQLTVIAIFGLLMFSVLIVGMLLLLDRSTVPSQVAQTMPTQVVQAAAPSSAQPTFPPMWTPTTTPLPTTTRRPQYTPTKLSVKPTSTIDNICTALKNWSSRSLQNIQEKANIMKAFLSQDPNHVDFHFVRALADRMSVVAKSQSKIQVPRDLADMNLLFVSGFELMGQSMSEAALGLETANYSLINQSYSTADQANLVIDRATAKWRSVAQQCGLDISRLP